ncbi:MAG: ribosome maturation factor RimP [Acidobacteriota bacterium]
MAKLPEELTGRLERLAASEGLALLAIEVLGTARKPTVRLVIERGDGGASLGDCEIVSRQASVLLDAYDPFPGAYTLEVTSPGIDRKFYEAHDYARFSGRPVRIRMRPTWTATSRLIAGVLEGKDGGVVRVRDPRGTVYELPETEVFETRLDPFAAETASEKPTPRRGSR